MPCKKGECNKPPVSGFRKTPSVGTVPAKRTTPKIKVAPRANHSPRFSSTPRDSNLFVFASPRYSPRRGTTIFSVTQVPAAAITNVEASMK